MPAVGCRSIDRLCLCLIEALERRLMCHAAHAHDDAPTSPEHLSLAEFYEQFPDIAGSPWDIDHFDPQHTGDPTKFRYDPHLIEDDGTFTPAVPTPVAPDASRAVTLALPDLLPITGAGLLSPFLDTTEIPGRNLLRFSTGFGNRGGPLLLSSAFDAVDDQGRQIVTQTVYNYDSTANSFAAAYQREAGRFVWHPSHGHFHLEGYAAYRLRESVNGQPGPVALRADGTPAAGDKIGFCLLNSVGTFSLPGGAPSSTLPGYTATGQQDTSCGFVQGIKVGRADVYSSTLDGQWIDVTGVPNGSYFLEVTLDAMNTIQEADETNNVIAVPVTLNANPPVGGIQPDRFEPNDSFAAAIDLGVMGIETQSGLTIHTTNESDYFRFTAASSGLYAVELQVGDRDVNLYLYDSATNLLGASTSPTEGPMTESVTATFVAGQTYYVLARGFGVGNSTSGVSSNYALRLLIKPTVDAQAPIPVASASGAGAARIHRNGPMSSPLVVNLGYSGSAVVGVDYDPLPASVIIGNEADGYDIPVALKPGASLAASKTVVVNVVGGSGYVIGAGSTTITLLENVRPVATAWAFAYETRQQVRIRFSEDVAASLSVASLNLMNTTTGQSIAAAAMQYEPASNTAVFTFAGLLPDGNYQFALAGIVADAAGNTLANSVAGTFYVLGGDANRDRQVDVSDLSILATHWQQSPMTFSQGDLNYDGVVDVSDLAILATHWQTVMPAPLTSAAGRASPRREVRLVNDVFD